MSISQNFPAEGPTLNLNFAGSKKLDPRITFTRTSTATYMDDNGLITIAPTNTPRFEHSVVGIGSTVTGVESLGLLIEESRTNFLQRSEEFDNATWSKTNVGVNTNFAVAPDGTTTAEEIFPTTVGSQLRNLSQSYTISTAQSYTFSIFVKKHTLTNNFLAIRISNHTATADIYSNFNFSTETFGVAPTTAGWTGNTSVQKLLNGWYRLSITANTVASTHTILLVNIWGGGYQGTTETIGNYLIWGAQLEVGAFPTSYIPTVASTVTRSADNASMTGTNFSSWYNPTASTGGTILAQARRGYSGNFSGYPNLYTINDGTSNNRILAYGGDTSTLITNYPITTGGVSQTDYVTVNLSTQNLVKSIHTFATNSSTFCVNGTLTTTDTSVTLPTVNRLFIGWDSGGQFWNGTISSLSYYPNLLTNSQLQNLTK